MSGQDGSGEYEVEYVYELAAAPPPRARFWLPIAGLSCALAIAAAVIVAQRDAPEASSSAAAIAGPQPSVRAVAVEEIAPAPTPAPPPRAVPAVAARTIAPHHAAAAAPREEVARPAPTAADDALVVQYQRVGHDLAALQARRGNHLTEDLWPQFRAIHVGGALDAEAREEAAAALAELKARIERRRGIEVSKECLDNPLAADCQ